MEYKGEQRRTKLSFGRTMMQSVGAAAVGKKVHLRMNQPQTVQNLSP